MISRIKLAWWRDALERLDRDPAPPSRFCRRSRAIFFPPASRAPSFRRWKRPGPSCSAPIRSPPTTSMPMPRAGGCCSAFSARCSARADADVERAGEGWALADLARHSGDDEEGRAALAAARDRLAGDQSWPSALRPLGMLAMLARRDVERGPGLFEPQGSPGRMLAHAAAPPDRPLAGLAPRARCISFDRANGGGRDGAFLGGCAVGFAAGRGGLLRLEEPRRKRGSDPAAARREPGLQPDGRAGAGRPAVGRQERARRSASTAPTRTRTAASPARKCSRRAARPMPSSTPIATAGSASTNGR